MSKTKNLSKLWIFTQVALGTFMTFFMSALDLKFVFTGKVKTASVGHSWTKDTGHMNCCKKTALVSGRPRREYRTGNTSMDPHGAFVWCQYLMLDDSVFTVCKYSFTVINCWYLYLPQLLEITECHCASMVRSLIYRNYYSFLLLLLCSLILSLLCHYSALHCSITHCVVPVASSVGSN